MGYSHARASGSLTSHSGWVASTVTRNRDLCKASLAIDMRLLTLANVQTFSETLIMRLFHCLHVSRRASEHAFGLVESLRFFIAVSLTQFQIRGDEVTARLDLLKILLHFRFLFSCCPVFLVFQHQVLLLLCQCG